MTPTELARRPDFRLDINGLRAIAVIMVVLYHFKVPGISGGFIGVDCFFVISGYLMTKIIDEGLSSGRFSLLRFYEARAVRIIPALAVLLLCLLVFGYFVIEPGSYTSLSQTAAAASLFVSDWKFALEKGYFNPTSERDWLLQTWSLSVEWQFYLAYPLAYLLLFRLKALWKRRLVILAGIAVASFALNVTAVTMGGRPATFAFFLMPFRAWEMIIGGLAFLSVARLDLTSMKRGLEFAGLALIAIAAFLFDRTWLWPSFGALLPTLGTALIILSSRGNASLLRAGPMQALGRWSYSIYLWHWPLAVGIGYFGLSDYPVVRLAGIAASVGLGYASYTLVENPARGLFAGRLSSGYRLGAWAGASVAILALAIGVNLANGLPNRARGDVAVLVDAQGAKADWAFPKECQGIRTADTASCLTRKDQPPELIVFGDSHAQMFYPLLDQEGWPATEFISNVGCPPFPDLERQVRGFDCIPFHRQALQRILASPVRKVIYASIWTPYFDFEEEGDANIGCILQGGVCRQLRDKVQIEQAFGAFRKEIRTLVAAGKDVAIVLPIPAPNRDIPLEVRDVAFEGRGAVEPVDLRHRPVVETLLGEQLTALQAEGAHVIDPRSFMCRDQACPVTDEVGRTLYIDGNHLRPRVMRSLGPMIRDFLDE